MGHIFARADAGRLPMADGSCDLVLGSPPYCDARSYGIGAQRGCAEWVEWMLGVTEESLRVARNCVVWVAAGVTRDRTYWPACEGLMWEWWKRGGSAYRPCYWRRQGIPGSGGKDWFRADIEYAMVFKRPGQLPWSDNRANGHPTISPKQSQRKYRRPGGKRESQCYKPPDIANPGNLICAKSGGGNLGWHGAHENEAPYPQALAEWFIKSLCVPGGIVVDPFSGSGTTVRAAIATGRRGIGFDLRESQCRLGIRGVERPRERTEVRPIAEHSDLPLFSPSPAG